MCPVVALPRPLTPATTIRLPQPYREAALPSFAQDQLTTEQYNAAQRFSLRVFGEPMFFTEPVCNGKHGWGCTGCHPVLVERDRVEAERRRPIAQPWHRVAA